MVYIYCLACEDTIWYVGSTLYPKKRLKNHRSGNAGCNSKHIPKGIDYKMIILEECIEEDRKNYERFYIEYLEPALNKMMPGRDDAEAQHVYYLKNKERKKKYNHEYWIRKKSENI